MIPSEKAARLCSLSKTKKRREMDSTPLKPQHQRNHGHFLTVYRVLPASTPGAMEVTAVE
jgi:hypothetical protein